MVNENLKKIVQPKKRQFTFLSYFGCAAIAGIFILNILGTCASIVTCPMDNIKTKLQTQDTKSTCEKIDSILKEFEKEKETTTTSKTKVSQNAFSTVHKSDCNTEPQVKYKNILSTIRMILIEDGFVKGFFKGLTPRIMSNAPSCAISWVTYEMVKHCLSKPNKH